MATANRTPAGRPPAPGTHATVHLLIGMGRQPVIAAEAGFVGDDPVTYLRLQVDDQERHYTRHAVDVSISGPPADVAALVAELGRAVDHTRTEEA
jgi:hypothetical protein